MSRAMVSAERSLREPRHGWVRWPDCVAQHMGEAQKAVDVGNWIRARDTGYELEESSPLEVWLYAGFLYYGFGDEMVTQHQIDRYWVDFYFFGADLAIEVDGREWHKDKVREVRRDKAIRATGAGIIHFFGSDVFRDPLWCARQTQWAIQDRLAA